MSSYIEQLVLGLLAKYLTGDVIAQVEQAAKVFVVKELRAFAASQGSVLEMRVVDIVAKALGVDDQAPSA